MDASWTHSPNTSRGTHLCRRRHPSHITSVREALIQAAEGWVRGPESRRASGRSSGRRPRSPPGLFGRNVGAFDYTASGGNPQSGQEVIRFQTKGKFLRTLVFPLKQISEKLFSGGSRPSCSPSSQGWEQRKWRLRSLSRNGAS